MDLELWQPGPGGSARCFETKGKRRGPKNFKIVTVDVKVSCYDVFELVDIVLIEAGVEERCITEKTGGKRHQRLFASEP